MKHPTLTSRLALQRFAWMVALVVVLRVAAWELHNFLDFHADSTERCQACLVMERSGDSPLPAAGEMPAAPLGEAPQNLAVLAVLAAAAPCPLPRGPPSTFS